MTLPQLRDKVAAPALLSHAIADGVLRHIGFACWEMPATRSGGYMNGLELLDVADEQAWIKPQFQNLPGTMNAQRLLDLRTDGLRPINLAELGASGVYDHGTSISFQNTTFSPERSSGGIDSVYLFTDELNAILSEWGKPIYVHLGAANNADFFIGELRYNAAYGLRTRGELSNPWSGVVNGAAFGADDSTYIRGTDMIGSDMVFRQWYHPVYDTTNPTVTGHVLTSIADTVRAWGNQLRYVVNGESAALLQAQFPPADRSTCGTEPLPSDCQVCEQVTNYPAAAAAGFRAYLTDILGLTTVEAVNERWDSDYAALEDIDPTTTPFCPGNPKGLEDWRQFWGFLGEELALAQTHAAKGEDHSAHVSGMRFGIAGCEHSWMTSDQPSLGDWSGETSFAYLHDRVHPLALVADAARLGGVPVLFPFTAPPYIPAASVTTDPTVPPVLRAIRTYTQNEVRWMFRDLLIAGGVHVGYLWSIGVGFGAHQPSVDAVTGGLDWIRDLHDKALALSGPWQRTVLHVERAEDMTRPKFPGGSGRCSYHLQRRFRARGRPTAMITSTRPLERPLARWWLERSLVIVPYPADVVGLRDVYAGLFASPARGAALLIEQTTSDDPPAWVDPVPVVQTTIGAAYRYPGTNVFWFGARHPGPCGTDQMWGSVAQIIDHVVVPAMDAVITASLPDGDPYIGRPIVATPVDPAEPFDVVTSFVTDGLTWTVAASNLADQPVEFSLSVRAETQTAIGATYSPLHIHLGAGATEIIVLTPTAYGVSSGDVVAAIAELDANLTTLGTAGFAVGDALAVLARASDLRTAGYDARAAAAVVAVARMPLLRVTGDASSVTVQVSRAGLPGEAASSPMIGAAVRFAWPLNGGESGPAGVTDGSGEFTAAPGAPSDQRWDFATQTLVVPPAGAADLLDVYVTATDGASSKASLTL